MKNKGIFIAVEGVIGVGKTTLCELLAKHYACSKLNEIVDENPFLAKFYDNKAAYALQTEAFFLFNRLKQLEDIKNDSLNQGLNVVSDYAIIKNLIFAGLTLNPKQLHQYKMVYHTVISDLPTPDIIVYLKADINEVTKRIRKRNRSFELNIEQQYLIDLANEYQYYFNGSFIKHHFNGKIPTIIEIDTTKLDVLNNPSDLQLILDQLDNAITELNKENN